METKNATYCEVCKSDQEKVITEETVHLQVRGYDTEFVAPVARCKECGKKMYDEQCSSIALSTASQIYMKAMDYSPGEVNQVVTQGLESGMSMSDIEEELGSQEKWITKWIEGKIVPKQDAIKRIKNLKTRLEAI